jgi:hypothetical protein
MKAIIDRAIGRDDQARKAQILLRAQRFANFSDAEEWDPREMTVRVPKDAVKLGTLRPRPPRA